VLEDSAPAAGAITDLLAGKARRLIAVELDRVLSAQLRMKFNMHHNVEIIEGDILKIELDTVFGAKPGKPSYRAQISAPEPARVIGNLPYYITSDILFAAAGVSPLLLDVVIHGAERKLPIAWRLRREAADYGLLSATAQLLWPDRATLHASAGSVRSAPLKFIRVWFGLRSSLGWNHFESPRQSSSRS